ncbi:MAG: hypothetical protein JST05_01560 [Acidobacteria bacterium]|nr:hypothetical protein [Acidobacteriota bacterium]
MSFAAQPVNRIHWSKPVDLAPQYVNGDLLIHCGSPVITANDTVIMPVKTGATSGFRVEARNGVDGSLMWKIDTGYVLPPGGGFTPSYNMVMTASGRLYYPESGGRLAWRDTLDSASGAMGTAVFYGASTYASAPSSYDGNVMVTTPLTVDANGDVFFGFEAQGSKAVSLVSGIARVDSSGNGVYVSATDAANDAAIIKTARCSAPALSNDGSTVYVAVRDSSSHGYLLALNSTTLATLGKVALTDPASGKAGVITDSSTASPTVGPDGDVYFGVLESSLTDPAPSLAHNDRGWLLHYDASLSTVKTPGSFGWDDTPSIVPASMVPSYTGTSSYLVMTKYNNYYGAGTGDGLNRLAVLDPNATENDPIIPTTQVMKEVLTVLGVTPDPGAGGAQGAVHEWCINTAVVDPTTLSIYVNSEDGWMYRWDMTTNTLADKLQLTNGLGEAYTPTVMGPDGRIYCINNAALFSIGQ